MRPDRERGYWTRHAKNYDRSMSLLGRPIPRMLELVGESVRGCERVLEVAAGTGVVTQVLAREAKHVVATDYAEGMLAFLERHIRAARITNVTCEQADIYALRFDAQSFDAVVAANVLHLVPDLGGAIAALRRVLRPGGRLVLPTFCHDETTLSFVVSRALALSGFPSHRRFTARSLQASLARHGIVPSRFETIPGVIPIGFCESVSGR